MYQNYSPCEARRNKTIKNDRAFVIEGSWSSTVEIDDIVGLNYTTSPVFRSKKPSSIEDPLSPIKLDPLATPFLCKPWNGASRRQQGKQSFNSSHNISTAPSSSLKISSDNGYPRHKKWITKEILEMIAVRDKLYRSMKNQPSPELVSMYKKVRKNTHSFAITGRK